MIYGGWQQLLVWLQALLQRRETIDDRKPVS
jgi:hypothetical protein